jgi:phage tail tube protein FII
MLKSTARGQLQSLDEYKATSTQINMRTRTRKTNKGKIKLFNITQIQK